MIILSSSITGKMVYVISVQLDKHVKPQLCSPKGKENKKFV